MSKETFGPLRVKLQYSFWQHPIKWFRNRKKRRLLQALANYYWKNGGEEEYEKSIKELLMYGQTKIGEKTFRVDYLEE